MKYPRTPRIQRMSCEVEPNIERLIELVQERTCIWDISSENYKDKNLKKGAWREICEELVIGFNDLDNKEMIAITTFFVTFFMFKIALQRYNRIRPWPVSL